MIGRPPVLVGGFQVTSAFLFNALATTEVGAPGTVDGTTGLIPVGVPDPAIFVATTVTEYAVPFVSPVMVQLVDTAVHDSRPGFAVAV